VLLLKKRGFTLIELLVVIAIIAVLAAVVTPLVFRQVAKGKAAAIASFHNTVKIAAISYFSDTGAFPPACNSYNCNGAFAPNGGFVSNGGTNPGWDGPYLDRWPGQNTNPFGGDYNWRNAVFSGNCFGLPVAERYIIVTDVVGEPDKRRIDRAIDGDIGGTSGKVRYNSGCFGGGNVGILVSRDGPIS
jgi:general secretion pathway protein G